jgi:NadR type nicotinamide-nucleotide adenylyltransferase
MKVAILGPESTGKTELASQLAEYFKALWIPEFAREYVESLTSHYTYEDVCNIASKQIEQEKYFNQKPKDELFFFDTDLIITKVWFQYLYHQVPQFVTEWLVGNSFDFYLLCAPDLPWEFDPVREHGDDRDYFFEWYKREIELTGKPYVVVDGVGSQRTQNAIDALKNIIPAKVLDKL